MYDYIYYVNTVLCMIFTCSRHFVVLTFEARFQMIVQQEDRSLKKRPPTLASGDNLEI